MENVVGTYINSESKIIHVILDRMAWVLLSDLSESEANLIKRRCIYVPKKDRFNADPKPVTLFEEMIIDGVPYLGIPKGYMTTLIEKASSNTKFEIKDNRNIGRIEPIEFVGNPRPYQVPIERDLMKGLRDDVGFNMGICEASTGAGKTFLGQRVRNKLSVRAVLPFHKAKLMWVWIRSIKQFEPDAKIGIIGQLEDEEPDKDGKFKKSSYCDFEDCDYVLCLYQTLISEGFENRLAKKGWTLEQFYNYFGLMMYDEINRGGSEKFSTTMRKFNTKYILGLTGTLRRSDGNVGILNSYCGNTLHKFEGFATEEPYVHFVQTGFQFDLQKYPHCANMEIMSYSNRILPKIASRNQLIVSKLLQALEKKRNIIVFCHTHNLINEIHRILRLNFESKNLPYKVGRYTAKSPRSEILFCENEANVVIATKKDADDGIDIPRLDTCFLVDPQGDAEQMIGRILRSFDGDEDFPAKQNPLVVYFIDKTTQSKSMVHAFNNIVLKKKEWKSNYKAFFDDFNDKARSFKQEQEQKKNSRVIVRKRINQG